MVAEIVSSSSSPIAPKRPRHSSSDSDPHFGYGSGKHRSIVLKRSGLAKISVTSLNPKLKGELRWLLTPMLLKTISLIKTKEKEKRKKKQKIIQYPQISSYSDFTTNSTIRPTVTAIYQ